MGGGLSTQTEPTDAQGVHANSIQIDHMLGFNTKSLRTAVNPRVMTTAPHLCVDMANTKMAH